MPTHLRIILIDGYCVLCNNFAKTILKRDKNRVFAFGTLQSPEGERLVVSHNIPSSVDSIVYLEDGETYTHSTAALKILSQIPKYSWMKVFFILPKSFRDWGYKVIAKNRYKWFGRREECLIPTIEERERFIG